MKNNVLAESIRIYGGVAMNKSDRLAALRASLGLYLELPMKISVLVLVCTAFAGQASAASISAGYHLGGINVTCGMSGQGSSSIDQSTTGCADYISSGSFYASGSGDASYDTLRATAGVSASDLNLNHYIGGNGSLVVTASGSASYDDRLTIDVAGRTGDTVDLVFTTAMNGAMSTSGDDSTLANAAASFNVYVDSTLVSISQGDYSTTDPVFNDFNPGLVQIELGTSFPVSAQLKVSAKLLTLAGNGYYTGDALSAFGNSAGITSFELFETGSETSISNWNLTSESGKFGFYTVVPVPAAAWLFGSGLLGLIGTARRKEAA
jgi:hypothetical protein